MPNMIVTVVWMDGDETSVKKHLAVAELVIEDGHLVLVMADDTRVVYNAIRWTQYSVKKAAR